jgi:chemotaxis protein methyltransferase CheR
MAGQLVHGAGLPVTADDLETVLFLKALEDRFGAHFLDFDVGTMHDKLVSLATASGVDSISALQGRVLRDEALAWDVIHALNGNAGPVLDSVFHLMALRCPNLPPLRSAPWPAVWVADCPSMHAPLLLLALLTEENLAERTRIFVTSGVEQALERMRTAPLSGAEVARLEALHLGCGGTGQLRRYLQAHEGGFVLDPDSALHFSWHVHHLGSDASFREFDAIIAPRRFAEYNDNLRTRAIGLFSESLYPFGVLQLNDMSCSRAVLDREQLVPVLGEYGVYRRAGLRHPPSAANPSPIWPSTAP